MNVIQVGPFPPPYGGVEMNLLAIHNYLREHGHRSVVINITRYRKQEKEGVFYPKSAFGVLRLLLREAADILHLQIGGELPLRLLLLGLLCAAFPGRKAVLTFHSGGYPSSPRGRSTTPRSFRAFVIRRFDAVIAINPEIAGFYRKCGVPPEKIHFIRPHAIEMRESDLPESLQTFFASHSPVLLSISRLEPEYDLPMQIRTLGRVRERHPRAGLLLLGSGSREAELRRLIAEQPWARHVLLPGDVPHSAALRAIRQADVLLRTTWYDGDAISIREALLLGTPVVATDNGMRPEGCRLIPVGDSAALESAIEKALAEGRPAPLASGDGRENMEAVAALYSRLLSPQRQFAYAGEASPERRTGGRI